MQFKKEIFLMQKADYEELYDLLFEVEGWESFVDNTQPLAIPDPELQTLFVQAKTAYQAFVALLTQKAGRE
jgi:hypothetical protein